VICTTEEYLGDNSNVGGHLAVGDHELTKKPIVIIIGIILFINIFSIVLVTIIKLLL